MKILSHGLPFFCAYDTWQQYKGKHEVRSLSAQGLADYRLRPEVDTWEALWDRISGEFRPDLVLVWTPENDPPPLGIERAPMPVVCLAGDWNLFHQAQEVNFGRYDVVLSDKPGTQLLRNAFCTPHFWGPLYAQNTRLHIDQQLPRDIDVLYIGNLNLSHRGERGRWLQRLAMLDPRWNILLTTNVWGREYPELMSRARIVFNHSVRGELNLRVFESMACGALAFFEESNAEVRDYFVDGEDIVLYNDENFEEKLEFYLNDEAARARIARQGQEKARAFAGEARFDDLIDFIMAQPRSGRPFNDLPAMERDLHDHLMITVSQRVEYGPLERRLGRELVSKYPHEPRAWSALGKSIMFYRDHPPHAGEVMECIDAHKRALSLDPTSIIHALNGAQAAQAVGNAKAEEIFLTVAERGSSIEPSGYLCGNWQDSFWTAWLRARAEGGISLAWAQAEVQARFARLEVKRGNHEAALARWDQALAFKPDSTVYAEERAETLWSLGRQHDALAARVALLPEFPLNGDYRLQLAEKCATLGFGARAQQCLNEAERIFQRLRVPHRDPLPPAGHAATREPAPEPVATAQERALRAKATASGEYASLLWFLATLGRGGEVRDLAAQLSTPADLALWEILAGEDRAATEWLDLLASTKDISAWHAVVKRLLANGDADGAWLIVTRGQTTSPTDVTCLNLFARYCAQHGDVRLQDAVAQSLAIAPRQEDIAALPTAGFPHELYLGAAPRLLPVSFYLPAYNVERYIRDTLEHVLELDYPLAELFVVDDGATDTSVAIAREFPVTLLRHPENKGLAAARNTALAAAQGEWLLSVDTDARPEPDYARKALLEVETDDGRVGALGGVLIEEFQDAPADKWRARMMAQHHGPVRQCPPWFLYGSTLSVRRAAALAVGGYDEAHRTNGEDTELCKALGRHGLRLCYAPGIRAHHLRRDDVESVLRTWWNWHYWVKVEANAWTVVGGLVRGMLHQLASASGALQRFVDSGERDLWYITLLFVFYEPLSDFAQALKTNLLTPGEARALADAVLHRADQLDARLGGRLAVAIRRDVARASAPYRIAPPADLLPGLAHEVKPYFDALDQLLTTLPAEVYAGALEGAGDIADSGVNNP